MSDPRPKTLRCAIYTRKSTEEGLEQAFNSLDAHEACAAYIMSQVGEGWTLAPGHYDDGGYSGGSMDRPGLQKLLVDIGHGLVDVVVVYKIDRLTRSLADFAKIVERLDARGASFVSVTQAFNTTTSMGRLTLNVLLSFAQFEREVGAERVRDKIAASRKKGMWMGGSPPLGYDVADRKLVINLAEAETIRWLFSRYLELRSIAKLRAEIEARGIRTKSYVSRTGRAVGGQRWYVGPIRHLLRNRVYVGEAVHKTNIWPGEHAALLERSLFDAVQTALDASRVERRQRMVRRSPGLLTGLVHDDAGNRMSPQAQTKRGSAKSRVYYVSQAKLQGRDNAGTLPRVSAQKLEALVLDCLSALQHAMGEQLRSHKARDADRAERMALAPLATISGLDPSRLIVREHIRCIVVGSAHVSLDVAGISRLDPSDAEGALAAIAPGTDVQPMDEGLIRIHLPVALGAYSTAKSLDTGNTAWRTRKARHDSALLRALALAHSWRRSLESGAIASIEGLGAEAGLDRSSARYMLRLAFLAPDIQRSILDGTQPATLTVRSTLQKPLPVLWSEQRAVLGIHRPSE